MAINDPSVTSAGRQPRALAQVNGVSCSMESCEVDTNTHFQADTFRVTIPVNALPDGVPLSLLFGTADLFVEVFAGFPSDPNDYDATDLTSLIYGKADEVAWEVAETAIEISGRDLTSLMIDRKSVAKYPNQVSSAIVTQIAQSHNLTPVVTATSTLVGKYYEIDHVRNQDDRTEWDLIAWLAREENFIAFVQGHSLYFQPAPSATQDPYVIAYSAGAPLTINATGVKVGHSKTIAKDIVVKVHSWNRRQAKGFTATAKATRASTGGPQSAGAPQTYEYVIPNLDKAQADARAHQLLQEISKHELTLEIDGPADLILQRADVIQVTGTNSPVDQVYFPTSIVRSMSFDGGFEWKIEAKNHSPYTETDS